MFFLTPIRYARTSLHQVQEEKPLHRNVREQYNSSWPSCHNINLFFLLLFNARQVSIWVCITLTTPAQLVKVTGIVLAIGGGYYRPSQI